MSSLLQPGLGTDPGFRSESMSRDSAKYPIYGMTYRSGVHGRPEKQFQGWLESSSTVLISLFRPTLAFQVDLSMKAQRFKVTHADPVQKQQVVQDKKSFEEL